MDSIVQCELLFTSLSDHEKKTFVSTIVNDLETDLVANAIFEYFCRQISKFKYDHDSNEAVSKVNNALCSIIRSRKTKTLTKQNLKLDHLPYALLSSVASFLDFGDILSFQQSNRSILVGIRALPLNVIDGWRMQDFLDFAKQSNHRLLCKRYFDRFRLCGEVSLQYDRHDDEFNDRVSVDMVPKMKLKDITSWNDTSISIVLRFPEFPHIGGYLFKELSECDLSGVKDFSISISHMNDAICDTLQRLAALNTLGICFVDFTDRHSQLDSVISPRHITRMASALSNMCDLNDLSLHVPSTLDYGPILCAVAQNLQQLSILSSDTRFSNCRFTNLQKLVITLPTYDLVQSLATESLPQLKTLHLKRVRLNDLFLRDNPRTTKTLDTLFTVPTLQNIHIDFCRWPDQDSKFCAALSMLELFGALKSVHAASDSKREFLKLCITAEDSDHHQNGVVTNAVSNDCFFMALKHLLTAVQLYCNRFDCLIVLEADDEPLSDFTRHAADIPVFSRSIFTYKCDCIQHGYRQQKSYQHQFKLRTRD